MPCSRARETFVLSALKVQGPVRVGGRCECECVVWVSQTKQSRERPRKRVAVASAAVQAEDGTAEEGREAEARRGAGYRRACSLR